MARAEEWRTLAQRRGSVLSFSRLDEKHRRAAGPRLVLLERRLMPACTGAACTPGSAAHHRVLVRSMGRLCVAVLGPLVHQCLVATVVRPCGHQIIKPSIQ
jgi:hypothetical protein